MSDPTHFDTMLRVSCVGEMSLKHKNLSVQTGFVF